MEKLKAVTIHVWLDTLLVIIILAGYFLVAVQRLELPGPEDNEMWAAAHAKAFIKGELQPGILEFRKQYISLWGHPLAVIMGGPTPHGPLKVYLLIPAILLFGANIYTYRLTTILIGALILVFTYLLCRKFFGGRVGAFTVMVLLATDPTFLFFMRDDPSQVTPIMICLVAGLYFVVKWYTTRVPWNLYLGAFLFGLGLWSRLHFIWFLIAAGLASLFIYRREWIKLAKTQQKQLTRGMASFLFGASPFIVFFIATRAAPIRELATVFEHTDAQVDNRRIVENLIFQIRHFFNMLYGQALLKDYTVLPDKESYAAQIDLVSTALPFLFGLSVAYAVYLVVWKKNNLPQWRYILFITLVIGLILVQSVFTVSGFHSYNLVLIWPLPHIVIGLAVSGLSASFALWRGKVGSRALIMLLVIVVVLAAWVNLNAVKTYYQELQRAGPTMKNSDAIFNLVEYFNQHAQGKHIVLMDWGIGKSLYALSATDLDLEDAWAQLLYPAKYDPTWDKLFSREDNLYVFRVARYSMVNFWLGMDGPRIAFEMAMKEKGYFAQLEDQIYQRNGEAFYEIYTLRQRP